MNKGAKKRAFFICAAIFVMYILVGFGITEKVTMKRIATSEQVAPNKMNLALPKVSARREPGVAVAATHPSPAPEAHITPATSIDPAPVAPSPVPPQTSPVAVPASPPPVLKALPPPPPAPSAVIESVPPPQTFVRDGTSAEPSLFISIPIICYALREGLIEKEGLIFGRKEGYNKSGWKKPLDILNDKDQEGLKSISKAIGKKQILSFLKKEGITNIGESTTEDIILGKGYVVEKKKLLDLYDKYVTADYQRLFPFFLDTVGIVKNRNGFEFVRPKDAPRERREKPDEEWLMPNLSNLTIRDAIEKLSGRTAKIKVYGSGTVTDQQPKPFQRASGEAECIIYGRAGK